MTNRSARAADAGETAAIAVAGVSATDASAPHWSTEIVDQALEHERAERARATHAAATAATFAALIQSGGGVVWIARLVAELESTAQVVNVKVGRSWLRTQRTLSGSVSLAADTAYVLFAPAGFVPGDPGAQEATIRVVVQPPAAACWQTEESYRVDLNAGGELVIDGRGPEAFAAFVCTPWLRTLSFNGR